MRKPLPIPKGFIVVGRRELEIYNQRLTNRPKFFSQCTHCPYYDHSPAKNHTCLKEDATCPVDTPSMYLVPEEVGPELLMIKMELDS